jgi:hypothetical protein
MRRPTITPPSHRGKWYLKYLNPGAPSSPLADVRRMINYGSLPFLITEPNGGWLPKPRFRLGHVHASVIMEPKADRGVGRSANSHPRQPLR